MPWTCSSPGSTGRSKGMTETGSRICSIRPGVRDWSKPSPVTSTSCQAVLTSSPGGRPSREEFARRYEQAATHPLFSRALTAVVLLYTAAAVVGSMLFVGATLATNHGPSAAALGQLVSTLLGAALVVRGVLALPTSHIEAYRWFLRGILVWLLITQVFIFYDSQPIALAGLAFDVVAYAMLRYAISHEIDPSTTRDRDSTQTRDRPDRTANRPSRP